MASFVGVLNQGRKGGYYIYNWVKWEILINPLDESILTEHITFCWKLPPDKEPEVHQECHQVLSLLQHPPNFAIFKFCNLPSIMWSVTLVFKCHFMSLHIFQVYVFLFECHHFFKSSNNTLWSHNTLPSHKRHLFVAIVHTLFVAIGDGFWTWILMYIS